MLLMLMVWFERTTSTHMLFITHYSVRCYWLWVSSFKVALFMLLLSKMKLLYLLFSCFRGLVDNTIKLIGAGAFAFHPTLEWIFVGDRSGALLAWDVSTERPNMIGMWVNILVNGIQLIFNLVLNELLKVTCLLTLYFLIKMYLMVNKWTVQIQLSENYASNFLCDKFYAMKGEFWLKACESQFFFDGIICLWSFWPFFSHLSEFLLVLLCRETKSRARFSLVQMSDFYLFQINLCHSLLLCCLIPTFCCDFRTQVGSHPITSISWMPVLSFLVTVSKDGGLQVWKTRVLTNPNKQPMLANFFERAGFFFLLLN